MVTSKKLVGIFSREGQTAYDWLIKIILKVPGVKDVRPIFISNDSSLNFQAEASKCSFAILYHSRKRGRVNVTDVTDSLYDQELKYLSQKIGKPNVLVVIDDLEDSSDGEKNRLLENQPSLKELAQDVFIFTAADKACLSSDGSVINEINNYPGPDVTYSMSEKLKEIKKIIEGRKANNGIFFGDGTNPDIPNDPGGNERSHNGSWWKRHQHWIFQVMVIAVVLIIVAIAVPVTVNSHIKPKSTTSHPGPSTTTVSTSSTPTASSIKSTASSPGSATVSHSSGPTQSTLKNTEHPSSTTERSTSSPDHTATPTEQSTSITDHNTTPTERSTSITDHTTAPSEQSTSITDHTTTHTSSISQSMSSSNH
ncbi:uncharacterized protein O3C94_018237 isoform 1-T2 [Discoglossus pictus]